MKDQDEKVLEEQAKILETMAQENALLFEAIGVKGADITDILNDRTRFNLEEWMTLQRHREVLEKAIDERIVEATSLQRSKTNTMPHIQGHWIWVR